MLAAERRQAITRLIQQQSGVRVEELVAALGASDSTIRRDLEQLERQGVLKRTHGGATAIAAAAAGQPFDLMSLSPVKVRIGEAAARLVGEGETVFLGPGTTTLAVAYHLAHRKTGTAITNALNIAMHLTRHSSWTVILTGGQVERPSTAISGYLAGLALRELRADKAIMGVRGIHLPDGFTGDSLPAVELLRTVLEIVPQVVIVADSSKWDSSGPAFLAPLEAADVIVTDLGAPPAMVWDLYQLGIQVIQV